MRGAPKTLWAFAVLSVAFPFAYALFGDLGEVEVGAGAGAFMALVLVGLMVLLLRGSRIVWSLLVFLGGATVLTGLFTGQPWWAISSEVVALALLLVPPSWRYVWSKRSRLKRKGHGSEAEALPSRPGRTQTSWDRSEQTDLERPSGWYLVSGAPARMRYWDANASKWTGSTKTPYKVKREWEATRQE